MNKIDLSIIIPVHNLENYIQPLLSTLWNQRTDGIQIEYVFCFDRCTDHSMDIVLEWSNKMAKNKKASSIIMLSCNFGRPGLTRNFGLENSSGEYIWFVDGDDWLISEKAILVLYNTIKSNNLNLLRFGYMSLYKKYNNKPNQGWMMVWRYIYRKDFLSDIKFGDKLNEEDNDFSTLVCQKANWCVPEIQDEFYFYNYFREGSLTYPIYH